MPILALSLWQPTLALAAASLPADPGDRVNNVITGFRGEALAIAPGMSVAVVKDGHVIFEQGYGVENTVTRVPVTPQTRFAVGSLTKQFTATLILKLAEQHRVDLNNALSQYLPQLPNAKIITVRELLWHTSGLHNYPNTDEHKWPLSGQIQPAALFSILATDQPDFEPGTQRKYANTNYAALAEIVAQVSGKSYAQNLSEQIFKPLGMRRSGYGYAGQQSAPIAAGYAGPAPLFKPYSLVISLDLYYGAGGIVSSAHDMALWLTALMQHRIINATSTRALWSAGHLNNGDAVTYAMGFVPASVDGHAEVWHNGFAPTVGGYCYDAIFPSDNIGVVILSNGYTSNTPALAPRIVKSIFEALVPTNAATPWQPHRGDPIPVNRPLG